MNLQNFKRVVKYPLGLLIGFSIILLIMITLSYKNIKYQSQATIDYVYSVKKGEAPEYSDTWLAEKYCTNELGLKTMYPEKEDECNYILGK